MRIITGKFKKSNLYAVPGFTTRPTTDFSREVIFSVLGDVDNFVVLDLFAGSGALGLEALSRNADFIDFVEFSEKAIRTIFRNIEKLRCIENCRIHRRKVSAFLTKCEQKYDLILMDPPYSKNLVNKTISSIFSGGLLKPEGKIVIEHASLENLDSEWEKFIYYQKKYGKTTITVLVF